MSLKAFHILFVTASTLTAFFFGGWLLNEYGKSHETAQLACGLLSLLAGFGLIWYGKIVLRKLKHISYL